VSEERDHGRSLSREIGRKAARRLRARGRAGPTWAGLGAYGVVGWSIVIPTLAGIALGVWVDDRWPSRFSWTLMLITAGLLIGCWNAWRWVTSEQRAIRDADGSVPREDEDD